MSLIKGPFSIKVDEHILNNVSNIIYSENKLKIDILISDFDIANLLLDNNTVHHVFCIGSSNSNVGATYHVKKYKTAIQIEDRAIMVLSVIFDVWRVRIGEINASN